jgi:translation initiation factor 1 (eIF-1/SUI1)
METLFLYLLKSSGLIALFFIAYYFLLRKETFFKSNRWFLLTGLVTSAILPLVTFKKVIWIAAVPPVQYNFGDMPPMAIAAPAEHFEINWFLVGAAIYAIGIIIFLFKFVFDFSNLVKTLKGKTVTQQADFKFIDVNEKVSPFSYFNYIVYNSSLYSEADLDHILEHEKVHCEQNHSADVLISRFFCILFWYNPFVWLYQKAILQNLEFIADSEALKNIADKKAYQITLLKVTTHDNCVAITNHFYQSLIKKRIIMLNKNQSKKWNSWKYALIVPVLIGFMLYFQVKVIAQERNNPNPVSQLRGGESVTVVIDKNTSDAEMKQHAEMLKDKYGIKLKFSKIKRNSAGEITGIKAVYNDSGNKSGTYQVNGDEPIKPLRFFRNDSGNIGFGNSKEVRIIRNRGDNADAGDDGNEENIVTVISEDGEDVIAPVAPVEPVAPVNGVTPVAPVAPVAPLSPLSRNKNVIIKKIKDKNGKISVTVNGETIDVDVDKIVNEAMAGADADFDFDFNYDSDDISDDVREAMEQAKIAIVKARPQMDRAKRAMERQKMRSEDSR